MKTPTLYLKDSTDLDAFLTWARTANIPYGGWRPNTGSVRDHVLTQMAKNPHVVFVTDPPGRAFAVVGRHLVEQSPSFTPLNSLSHLKRYLARCQAKP